MVGLTASVQGQVNPGAAPAGTPQGSYPNTGYPQNQAAPSGYPAGYSAGQAAPGAAGMAPGGAPSAAGQTMSQQAIPAQPPQPPFALSPQEEQQLDALLQAWQQSSDQVNTFSCEFRLREYNLTFGPPPVGGTAQPLRICDGELRYAKPDKGYYKITGIMRAKMPANPKAPGPPVPVEYEKVNDQGEHWVCDGKALYEVNATKKQLIERPLPPELRGKQISDGPMPFVFGAEAAKLKQRYWMRIVTPPGVTDMIYLEAVPKQMADTTNFVNVNIMLEAATMTPSAVRIIEPDGNFKTYKFSNSQKNGAIANLRDFFGLFVSPKVPFGYTHVVEQIPTEQAAGQASTEGGQPAANVSRSWMPFVPR